jgi:uncharacterized protein
MSSNDIEMTAEPKEVIQRYLDALVTGDTEVIRDSFAEDATWTIYGEMPIAGPWVGRDQIVDEFLTAGVGSLFETGSHSFEFPTLIADGDKVALEWQVHARTATGADYSNNYCGIFIVDRGRIQIVREYLDSGYAARTLFPQR